MKWIGLDDFDDRKRIVQFFDQWIRLKSSPIVVQTEQQAMMMFSNIRSNQYFYYVLYARNKNTSSIYSAGLERAEKLFDPFGLMPAFESVGQMAERLFLNNQIVSAYELMRRWICSTISIRNILDDVSSLDYVQFSHFKKQKNQTLMGIYTLLGLYLAFLNGGSYELEDLVYQADLNLSDFKDLFEKPRELTYMQQNTASWSSFVASLICIAYNQNRRDRDSGAIDVMLSKASEWIEPADWEQLIRIFGFNKLVSLTGGSKHLLEQMPAQNLIRMAKSVMPEINKSISLQTYLKLFNTAITKARQMNLFMDEMELLQLYLETEADAESFAVLYLYCANQPEKQLYFLGLTGEILQNTHRYYSHMPKLELFIRFFAGYLYDSEKALSKVTVSSYEEEKTRLIFIALVLLYLNDDPENEWMSVLSSMIAKIMEIDEKLVMDLLPYHSFETPAAVIEAMISLFKEGHPIERDLKKKMLRSISTHLNKLLTISTSSASYVSSQDVLDVYKACDSLHKQLFFGKEFKLDKKYRHALDWHKSKVMAGE